MARIELAQDVFGDFARIIEYLEKYKVPEPIQRIGQIVGALDVLVGNPFLGRIVDDDHRELVVGRDSRGYLVLYTYFEDIELVLVESVRSQQEAAYVGPFSSNK